MLTDKNLQVRTQVGQVPDKNQCKDKITGEPKVQNPTRTENDDNDNKFSFGGASN